MYYLTWDKFITDRWHKAKVALIIFTIVEVTVWMPFVFAGHYSWRISRYFRSFFLVEQGARYHISLPFYYFLFSFLFSTLQVTISFFLSFTFFHSQMKRKASIHFRKYLPNCVPLSGLAPLPLHVYIDVHVFGILPLPSRR